MSSSKVSVQSTFPQARAVFVEDQSRRTGKAWWIEDARTGIRITDARFEYGTASLAWLAAARDLDRVRQMAADRESV